MSRNKLFSTSLFSLQLHVLVYTCTIVYSQSIPIAIVQVTFLLIRQMKSKGV